MVFFFILFIFASAIIVLISLFTPHLMPWYRPHLVLTASQGPTIQGQAAVKQPIIMEGLAEPQEAKSLDISLEEKTSRLENILIEKNIAIDKLQKQLIAEKSHRGEFEKVQLVLNEKIQDLRTQNK